MLGLFVISLLRVPTTARSEAGWKRATRKDLGPNEVRTSALFGCALVGAERSVAQTCLLDLASAADSVPIVLAQTVGFWLGRVGCLHRLAAAIGVGAQPLMERSW